MNDERAQYRRLLAQLAEMEAATPPPPSPELVAALSASLVSGQSLTAAASAVPKGLVTDPEEYAFGVLVGFGDWYAKVLHSPPDGFVFAEESGPGQMTLFPPGHPDGMIVIPEGYAPQHHGGRNAGRALATLILHPPGPDEPPRYVSRAFPPASAVLPLEVVMGVWAFACRDRLDGLARVSRHVQFLREARDAYELLEGSRVDSVTAASKLLSGRVTSPDDLRRLLPALLWLPERRSGQLSKALESDDDRVVSHLLGQIRHDLNVGALAPPVRVGAMTLAQVQQVCRNAGLIVEGASFQEEREIRARIRAMGFGRDADRLAANALSALENGRIDLFWEAMEARASGDVTWSTLLDEAVSQG